MIHAATPAIRSSCARFAAIAALALAGAAPAAQEPSTLAEGVKLVQTLYSQRRYQDAAREAERLRREHKDEVDAWMALAMVHLAPDWGLRRDARAEAASLRALRLAGRRPDVVATVAIAKHRQAKHDEALELVAELVDATPPKVTGAALAELLSVRADILLKARALDPDSRTAALADLQRAIAVSPGEATPRLLRAEALAQEGRWTEVGADLAVALAAAPGSKQVHRELQTCLQKLGRREEARRHFEIWQRLNRLTDSMATASAPTAEEARRILRELKQLNPADFGRRLGTGDAGSAALPPDPFRHSSTFATSFSIRFRVVSGSRSVPLNAAGHTPIS